MEKEIINKKLKMKNTKKKGKFSLFAYPEKPNYYIGVCPEFDLIQEGKTFLEAIENIKRTSINYLKTVIKFKMDDDLLNRKTSKEHWKKFRHFRKEEERRRNWEQHLRRLFNYDLNFPKILKERINA